MASRRGSGRSVRRFGIRPSFGGSSSPVSLFGRRSHVGSRALGGVAPPAATPPAAAHRLGSTPARSDRLPGRVPDRPTPRGDRHLAHSPSRSRLSDGGEVSPWYAAWKGEPMTRVGRGADAALLTGDVAEAHDVGAHLLARDARLGLPLPFVPGHHDVSGGGIARVREAVATAGARSPRRTYPTRAGVVPLTELTGLVGHDGRADGRLGHTDRSVVVLNDDLLIEEFAGLVPEQDIGVL